MYKISAVCACARMCVCVGGGVSLITGMQEKEGENLRVKERKGLSPSSPKTAGRRKQTVGAMDDRNKYRRRENGWVVSAHRLDPGSHSGSDPLIC